MYVAAQNEMTDVFIVNTFEELPSVTGISSGKSEIM